MAIVKAHAGAQVEDPRARIRPLPGHSQPRLQIEVLVFADEWIVDELADALGLRVRTLAEVEVVRRGLDQEVKDMRVLR